MATANLSVTNRFDKTRRYKLKGVAEIFPLDSSSAQPNYVVMTSEGKSFIISENLKEILVLFDGSRTLDQVAEAISRQQGTVVSDEQMQQIISNYIARHNLIEDVDAAIPSQPAVVTNNKRSSFDFVYKFPLISPRIAGPVVSQLTWLFKLPIAIIAIASIFLVHLVLYRGWVPAKPVLSLEPSHLIILYSLGLATALFHELGHASACRSYRCDHGAIGICLYLIFPAFYINLSHAWRLSGRQRAVIDVGGVYFQLLTTIPLFLIYLATENMYCLATIYSVDLMVLFSMNPILKFDGYWLLVDLSGLVNLQRRGLQVVKEIFQWSVKSTDGIPTLKGVSGKGKKFLLVTYSLLMVTIMATFLLLLLTIVPGQLVRLSKNFLDLVVSLRMGLLQTLVSLGRILMNLVIFLFLYRFLNQTVFRFFRKSNTGKMS